MRRRILFSFALLLLLFFVAVGVFTRSLVTSTEELQALVELHQAEELRQNVSLRVQRAQAHLQLSGTAFASDLDEIIGNVRALDQAAARCFGCHHAQETEDSFGLMSRQVDEYKRLFSQFITMSANERRRGEIQLSASAAGQQLVDLANRMSFAAAPKLQQRTAELAQTFDRSWRILAATLASVLLLSSIVAWRLAKGITAPVRALVAGAGEISRGRVGYQIPTRERGEFGRLVASFNSMSTSLQAKEKTIQGSIARLRKLNHAVLSFQARSHIPVAPSRAFGAIKEVIDAEQYGAVLPADDGDRLLLWLSDGESTESSPLEVSATAFREAVESLGNAPLIRNDATDADWPFGDRGGGPPIRSLLLAWIAADGEVGGALVAVNKSEGEFVGEDADSLGILATSHAEAIENSRLYADLRHQMQELEVVQRQVIEAEKHTALGTLAGGIAHDFNNILCAMVGHAQLLRGRVGGDERDTRSLSIIEESAYRAANLTRQLLTFSRRTEWETAHVDVNMCAKNVVRLLKHSIDKRISLDLDLRESSPVVEADPTQLEQVIMNLCVNARDAMPGGGSLGVRTDEIFLDDAFCAKRPELESGPHLHLAVSDTGSGMSKQTLSRVFEPFFTTKETGRGTGLGLSVVYGIVAHLDGVIEVTSELGKGTRFDIYIPAAAEGEPDSRVIDDVPLSAPASDEVVPANVLVVDDEEMILSFVSRALRSVGYKTWTACDGDQGLEMFARQHSEIDLVFLDMNMPARSGEEVLREIRKINPDVKVLLTSGFGLDGGFRELLSGGAAGFLPKPFKTDALLAKVTEVLSA